MSAGNVLIRSCRSDDMKHVIKIASTYFLDIADVGYGDCAVSETGDGRITGFAALVYDRFPEIHTVAVAPSYRGRGTGRKLVNYLISKIPAGHRYIYTRTTSAGFFLKMGFVMMEQSEKTNLWDDCLECKFSDTCRQKVLRYTLDGDDGC